MTHVFDIQTFGAINDGTTDCSSAITAAIMSALGCGGCVMIPPGRFAIHSPIKIGPVAANLSICGFGQNVSKIAAHGCSAFDFEFAMDGARQPWTVDMRDIGIAAVGKCGKAIRISCGTPEVISDHNNAGPALTNVAITSGADGAWEYGVILRSVWNACLTGVWISGDSCGGHWGDMYGAGVVLKGPCINTHLNSCRINFFADGVLVESEDVNSEGLFLSNCSMVAVKRGVTVVGNPRAAAPRMSTLTVVGGLVECRISGVGEEEISAGIYVTNAWTVLVSGVQILTEALPEGRKVTYGILAIDSCGVVASACDLNAVLHGFHIGGESRACCASGCTFTNCREQVVFAPSSVDCRSYGNVRFNDPQFEWSWSDENKVGFVE